MFENNEMIGIEVKPLVVHSYLDYLLDKLEKEEQESKKDEKKDD